MKDDKARLLHILSAIEKVEQFKEGGKDAKSAAAIMYEITIIGEAVRALSEEIKQQYPDIPWKDIIGMRNRLVHEYFDCNEDVLWDTVEINIPELKKWITAIVEKENN